MKISIQRECDADDGNGNRCHARIEVSLTIVDRDPRVTDDSIVHDWGVAAAVFGWRRTHGPGEIVRYESYKIGDNTNYLIPAAKAWVVCPIHAAKLICDGCGSKCPDCNCPYPVFDASEPK